MKHRAIIHAISLYAFSVVAGATDPPNILFILADDLGKEWIGCYGADDIETPHIDALAAGGMKFHNAYSMPQCTPSRVAFLTGTYPWRNGWVNHWDVPRWGVAYFDPTQRRNTTVASLLREAGYATTAVGKWQINDYRIEPQVMRDHGFDDWLMWTGHELGNHASENRYANPHIHTPQGSGTREGEFGPDLYTGHLIEFMRNHRSKPMFLYHAMALPHAPLIATPDEPDITTPEEKHKAMVRYLDKQVGRLVTALDELGLRDRTIIIFTTDNGSTRSITGSLRGVKISGGKAVKSESGVCAPFIVNAPGLVLAGVETHALTDFTDMLPTFMDLAGATIPDDLEIDGVSIAPHLLGKADSTPREWILAMGYGPAVLDENGVRGKDDFAPRVIRDDRFKVWVNNKKNIHRLHDLASDRLETANLLEGELDEASQAALRKFQAVIDQLPDHDARPLYVPRAPNPWDQTRK
ncbi:MAG: sulfatase-like hydrolase/transferase [Luteolibacter sp.]|jgi:arylsulfatase A-like enzyme